MTDMTEGENQATASSVAGVAREVEGFVAEGGWNQRPQLFALVPTEALLREQPALAEQLDINEPLTPVAQDELPEGDLADALATIGWPENIHGCALAQEIIVLPPEAEAALLQEGEQETDAQELRQAAADHPQRTEARLVAAVLRDGTAACVMRLRAGHPAETGSTADGDDNVGELIEHPELAPNLVDALKSTFAP